MENIVIEGEHRKKSAQNEMKGPECSHSLFVLLLVSNGYSLQGNSLMTA